MSLNLFVLKSCTGVSILLSAIYFIISSIYLDDVTKHQDKYSHPDLLTFFVITGLWLALFQLGIGTLIFRRLESAWKFWCLDHILVFLLATIVFSVAMAEDAHIIGGSTGNAFVGFSAIKFIFSFISALVVYVMGRRDGFSNDF